MIEPVRAGGKTPAELSREFECRAQTIINWVAQAARDEDRQTADAISYRLRPAEATTYYRQLAELAMTG